jgi:hypothetical protein
LDHLFWWCGRAPGSPRATINFHPVTIARLVYHGVTVKLNVSLTMFNHQELRCDFLFPLWNLGSGLNRGMINLEYLGKAWVQRITYELPKMLLLGPRSRWTPAWCLGLGLALFFWPFQ